MTAQRLIWKDKARMVWAIVRKDLLEALKNKNSLSVLISALFIAVMYRGLPLLSAASEPTRLIIYNPGDSVLVALLENSEIFSVSSEPSLEGMQNRLRDVDSPALGLAISQDFDQALEQGNASPLQAYVLNWFSPEQDETMRNALQVELTRLTGRPVPVSIEGNVLFLTPESSGLGVQAAMGLVFTIIMIGLSLIAHLFLEEKQNRTLDALLVSPASAGIVVVAKALVGLTYCMLGAAVALVINDILVVHWWLGLLAALCGSLFTVAIGLWLGMRIETRAQLGLWSWVFIIPLFFPMVIFLLEDLMPAWLVQASGWIPTVMIFNAVRAAFANPIPWGMVAFQLAYIMVWAAGILAVTAWQVRRQDRQETGYLEQWRNRARPGSQTPAESAPASPTAPPAASGKDEVQTISGSAVQQRIRLPRGLEIILAITGKDMRDMLKNKLALSIFLGCLLILLPNALLPGLLKGAEKPTFIFYEETRSDIVRTLMGRTEMRVGVTDSRQEFDEMVTELSGSTLGVVLPEGFDQMAGSGKAVQMDGYYAHWSTPEEVNQLVGLIEGQLGQASQMTVQVNLSDHALYPSAESGGLLQMSGIILLSVISTLGIALVPLLMVEEKEAHTFDAILVSPANFSQVVLAKMLAGLAYCLIASVVALFFYTQYFVHWPAVILTILLISALAVVIGLLVGMISDNAATTSLWGSLLVLVLLASALVRLFNISAWPEPLQALLDWLPGSVMLRMYAYTMVKELPLALLLRNALVLAGFILAFYLLTAWRVRRLEQR